MRIHRSVHAPARAALSWDELWESEDQGVIACWEGGREAREANPEIAERASRGELVPLPWKGGVEKATKKRWKYGTVFYLAMWQGLRGEDLDVDLEKEVELVCSATGMRVVITNNYSKYASAEEEA